MNVALDTTDNLATDFPRRHIGPSPRDVEAMLETVGASRTLGADGGDAAGRDPATRTA